ncbi:hypothetical protein A3D00_05145 [Candidatus Woesebacteria bacterium RIFCSPHIGHO2_02_FULL_38_9]|nr:MAG: hypothetical protein A3D00_05145 [Candidatus Woesebacteria bacterium RIFCSPHIGHO2_02_FULL_38_9]
MSNHNDSHNVIHYLATVVWSIIKGIASSSIWIIIGAAGFLIFQAKKSPYDIILGLPLILIGAGMTINNLANIVYSVFSPQYNRGVCIICKR